MTLETDQAANAKEKGHQSRALDRGEMIIHGRQGSIEEETLQKAKFHIPPHLSNGPKC